MAVAFVKRPPLWRVLDKSQYTHSPPGPKKEVEIRLCKHEFFLLFSGDKTSLILKLGELMNDNQLLLRAFIPYASGKRRAS